MRVRVLCPRYRFKEIPSLGRVEPVMIGLHQRAPEHCSLGRLSQSVYHGEGSADMAAVHCSNISLCKPMQHQIVLFLLVF